MIDKKTYYFLSFTWGLLMSVIGLLVAAVLIAREHRPKRFLWGWCFEIGQGWGGLNLGIVFLCEKGASDNLKCHEFGHSIQNCVWGAFTPFVVHLPSVARYHMRNIKAARGEDLPPYDAVWYEGQATRLGLEYYARESVKDEH